MHFAKQGGSDHISCNLASPLASHPPSSCSSRDSSGFHFSSSEADKGLEEEELVPVSAAQSQRQQDLGGRVAQLLLMYGTKPLPGPL